MSGEDVRTLTDEDLYTMTVDDLTAVVCRMRQEVAEVQRQLDEHFETCPAKRL